MPGLFDDLIVKYSDPGTKPPGEVTVRPPSEQPKGLFDDLIAARRAAVPSQESPERRGSVYPVPGSVPPGAPVSPPDTRPPRGFLSRMYEGIKTGFGESRVTPEESQLYPRTAAVGKAIEFPGRVGGAAVGVSAGFLSALAEKAGASVSSANTMQRDLMSIPGAVAPVGAFIGASGGFPTMAPQPVTPRMQGWPLPPPLERPPMTAEEVGARVGVPRGGALPPTEVAGNLGQALQQAKEGMTRARDIKFEQTFAGSGGFKPSVLEGMGTKFSGRLSEKYPNIRVTKEENPQTYAALEYLDKGPSQFKIENRVGPQMPQHLIDDPSLEVSLQGVKAIRERLNENYQDTKFGTSDRRTMKFLKGVFDEHLQQAVTEGLFSGDPNFLKNWADANKAHSDIKKYFVNKDAETNAMRKITREGAVPEKIANFLFGNATLGTSEVPIKLWRQTEAILGKNAPNLQQWREATWEHALNQKDGVKNLAGSTLGRTMYDEPTLNAMKRYAAAPKVDKIRIAPEVAGQMAKMALQKIPFVKRIPFAPTIGGKLIEAGTRAIQQRGGPIGE